MFFFLENVEEIDINVKYKRLSPNIIIAIEHFSVVSFVFSSIKLVRFLLSYFQLVFSFSHIVTSFSPFFFSVFLTIFNFNKILADVSDVG